MTVEYRTIRDAAEAWVREMNAIPQGMIQDLMSLHSYDWMEVTKPSTGDRVYVYEIPDEVDSTTHEGKVKSYNDESELYCIELDDGKLVSAEADDFEVEYDGSLPMWGTMWSFGDSCDDWWLEEDDGIRASASTRAKTTATSSESTEPGTTSMRNTGCRCTKLAAFTGMTRRPRKTIRCTLSKATPSASSAARKSGATRTALP